MERIRIGRIVNAVALKGEVKVYPYSDRADRFEELERIILKEKGGYRPYPIEHVRYQNNMVILKLRGVNDRNAAEALKECDVYITEEDLRPLPEDTFYVRDLIGCRVIDEKDGTLIGEIDDVLQNSAQDIYHVVTCSGGEALIPAVGDFIREVNIAGKVISIHVIPGLLE